jgi:hypothetical protein
MCVLYVISLLLAFPGYANPQSELALRLMPAGNINAFTGAFSVRQRLALFLR